MLSLYAAAPAGTHLLPRWANYWAESCGGQAVVADCILVLVAEDGVFSGRAARRFSDTAHRPWRAHWEARASLLLAANASAAMFEGRAATDTLPQNLFVVRITPQELQRRLAAISDVGGGVIAPQFSNGHARKFADYKPLYGDLFADLLSDVGRQGSWRYSHCLGQTSTSSTATSADF